MDKLSTFRKTVFLSKKVWGFWVVGSLVAIPIGYSDFLVLIRPKDVNHFLMCIIFGGVVPSLYLKVFRKGSPVTSFWSEIIILIFGGLLTWVLSYAFFILRLIIAPSA